jgi:hypothetical protein
MEIIKAPNGSFTYRTTCPLCLLPAEVRGLRKRALDRWDQGKGLLVQDAFPQLSAAGQEILVTGMHDSCFDSLFEPTDTT